MTDGLIHYERAFRSWILENGMSWERIDLAAHDPAAHTTAYRFLPAGQVDRAVVALHGAGNDALFAWIGLFKRLLRERCAVLTFDLPGHGRFNQGHFSAEGSVAVFSSVVGLAENAFGGKPVHAIGVSLGGSLLLHALPEAGQRLVSAAIIVAPLQIRLSLRNVLPELGWPAFRLLWKEREHYGFTGLIPSFGPFKRDLYPLRLESPVAGAFGYVGALNQILAHLDLEHRASEAQLPVLLVYGTADRIVPLEQGERIAGAIQGAVLVCVEGGTHLTTPMRAEAVDRVAAWVREIR